MTVPAEYGTILQYSIVSSAQILTEPHHVEIVERNTTQFAVSGLNPNTTYNCCVTAENLAGDGVTTCWEGNTFEDDKGCDTECLYSVVIVIAEHL